MRKFIFGANNLVLLLIVAGCFVFMKVVSKNQVPRFFDGVEAITCDSALERVEISYYNIH